MSKSRSKTPANKKNAPICFKKDHYYYYKQSDNEYLLFKAKENASDAPELKSFSILGEVSEDKTNIFYHLIKLKLQNFDAKNLIKDEISFKEVTKTIKGSKQNQVVVQKKVFKEIQDKGAKLQTEASKRSQKSDKQDSTKRKKQAEEEEAEEEEEEKSEEESDKEEEKNKKSKLKSQSKVKETPKKGASKDQKSKSQVVEKKKQTNKKQEKNKQKEPESESESESEEKEKKASSRLGRSKTPISKGKKTESQVKSTSKQARSAVKESPQKQGKTREAAGKKGKKNGKEDDEEEEDYPLVQKRPSRAKDAFFNRRQKRQQQKQDKEDAEQEEEDNQIDELDSSQPQDENEIERESEENQESGKKSQKKKSSKKTTKKAAKPAKEVPVFKLGKWNQKVEFQEKSEIFDSTSDEIKDDCCATCTSKEIIRAANTGNMELFKKLLNSENKISNEYQMIGPENQVEIIELLIKLDDEEMLKYFANFINNTPKEFKRAQQPKCYLKNISTGYNNKFAYGRATRKVALGRGNKEGNNAFTYDLQQYRGFPYEVIQKVLRHAKNYKTLETLRLLNNFNIDHQLNQALSSAVQAGNFEIVKKIAENAHKRNKEDITQLHLDALSEDPNHKVSKHEPNDILRNSYSYPPVTPIFLAAINPKTNKFLKDFLKENSQGLFQKDQNQKSLVHYAAACESPANLQALIEANANLKDITTDLSSALHFAAQYGRTKNVELLLSDEKYSDIKKKNKEGNHPIHLAAENGHVETIQAFLEKGVKLSLPGKDRMQMLHFAAAQNHLEVVKFIFEKKGKINSKDKFKRSPLVMAIRNNSIQVVSYLLSKGADFEQADSSNNTPLHYAAAYGSFESIELLLKAGADVNSVNSWNLTPLQIAQMKCHTRCLKYLIKQPNINVNCRDDEGKTLLANSVIQLYQDYENIDLNIEQIKFWLNANSDPNIADNSGKTPLHFIAEQSDKQIFISELVKKDQDYPIPQHQTFQAHKGYDYWNLSEEEIDTQEKEFKQKQNQSLQAAYKLAQQENQKEWQEHNDEALNLQENKALISAKYEENSQKKIQELKQKYTQAYLIDVVELLLQKKADVNQIATDGFSPLQIAIKEKSFQVFHTYMKDPKTDLEKGFGLFGIYNTLAENLNNDSVFEIMKEVLQKHGNNFQGDFLNKVNENGYTPIQVVVKDGLCDEKYLEKFIEILKLMIAKGAKLDHQVLQKFQFRPENLVLPENETDYAKQSRIVLQSLQKYLENKNEVNKEEFHKELNKKLKFYQEKEQNQEIQQDLDNQNFATLQQQNSSLNSEEEEEEEDEEENLNSEEEEEFDNDEENQDLEEDEEEDLEVEEEEDSQSSQQLQKASKTQKEKQAQKSLKEDEEKEQTEKDAEIQRLIGQIKQQYAGDYKSNIFHLIIKYKTKYIEEITQLFVENNVDYTQPDLFNLTPLHSYILHSSNYLESQFYYLLNLPKQKENITLQQFYTKQTVLHSFLRGSISVFDNLTKEQQLLKATEIDEILNTIKQNLIKKLLKIAHPCLKIENNNQQIPLLALFQSQAYSIENLREIMEYSDEFLNLINKADKTGKTLLHYMFINKFYSQENLQILLNYNCLSTLDQQEKNQLNTPLHYFLLNAENSETTQKCIDILLASPQGVNALKKTNKQKQTPLQVYINQQKYEIIPSLASKIATINAVEIINNRDENGLTAIFQFIQKIPDTKQTAKIFQQILDLGADLSLINPKDYNDQPLVIQALNLNKYRFIKGLAKKGAQLNIRQDYYKIVLDKNTNKDFNVVTRKLGSSKIPLIYTIQKRDEENVDLLLELGADPNYLDQQQRNSLHHALNTQKTDADTSFEIEKSLIKFKANISKDVTGRTPLHYCFVKYSIQNEQDQQNLHLTPIDPYESVSSICQAQKFDVNELDSLGKSALHYAAIRNSALSIKYLLRNGAKIDQEDKNGNTALALAILNKQENACTTLIENGANLHIKAIVKEGIEADPLANAYISEKGNYSVFLLAVKFNFLSLCYLLIEFGYDLLEPFLNALESQNFELLRNLFLQVPQDNQQIQEQNPATGMNIFHQFAKVTNSQDQAFDLIYDQIEQRQIPFDLQDSEGKTPLMYSIISNFQKLSEKLLEKNANINTQDNLGKTPLMYAIEHKRYQLVKKMLNQNFDINLKDKKNRTILHYMVYFYSDSSETQYEQKKINETSRIQQQEQILEQEKKQIENQLEYQPKSCQNIQLSQYGTNKYGRRYYYNTSFGGVQRRQLENMDWNFVSQQQFVEILNKVSKEILNQQDSKGYTAISTALHHSNNFCFIQLIQNKNIDIYLQDKKGKSVVQLAVENINKFELLNKYAKDLKLDQVDENGNTILHLAARSGLTKILEIVPEEKLSYNVPNKLGQTPLHVAIINKKQDFVIALLSKNLELNIFDSRNRLPLHYAVETNDIKIVHYLLKHGSQVYGLDDMLQSPLNLALSKKFLVIAAKLISHKSADEEIMNSSINITKEYVSVITPKILKKTEKVPDLEIMDLKTYTQKTVITNKQFVQKIEEKQIPDPSDPSKEITQITVYNTTIYPILTYLIKVLKIQNPENQFLLTSNPAALKQEIKKIKEQEEKAKKEEKEKQEKKKKKKEKKNEVKIEDKDENEDENEDELNSEIENQNEEENEEQYDDEEEEDQEDELNSEENSQSDSEQQQQIVFKKPFPKIKKPKKFSNFGTGFQQNTGFGNTFNNNSNNNFGFGNTFNNSNNNFGFGQTFNNNSNNNFGFGNTFNNNNNNSLFGAVPKQPTFGFGGKAQPSSSFQFGLQPAQQNFQSFGGFQAQSINSFQNNNQYNQDQIQSNSNNQTTEFDAELVIPKNISLITVVCEKGGSPMEYLSDEKQQEKCLLIEAIKDNDTQLVKIYAKSPVLDAEKFIQKYKKSALHYVVNPLDYGSYENKEIFEALLEKFPDLQVTDEKNMTVLDLATLQDSGILKEAIEKAGGQLKNKKMFMKRGGTSVITQANWPEDEIDYEEDSNTYLQAIKSKHNLSEEYIPKPDKKAKGAGLGDADGIYIVQDEEQAYYDAILSKVDIRQGPYGQNVFYKMQLLHSKGRSVYFVFTNWGKIGDTWGTQHQCTPFNTLEEAKALFLKVFKEKSGNDWKERKNFEKKKGKYMIQRRKKHINYKQYIEDFDFTDIEEQKKVQKQFVKDKSVSNFINFISNANNIRNSFQSYQLDQDLYSLQKQDILQALAKLDEIKKLVIELDEARSNMLNTDINKVFELQETIAVKSSEYYLLIPEKGFLTEALPTIDKTHIVEAKQKELTEILDLEVTSKIILGAHLQLENQKMHPTDYIFKSLNIRALKLETTHPEYKLIQNYSNNGAQGSPVNIQNIFAIERKGEAERIAQHKHYENRMVLWHGTKGYNLMSILSNGLVPVPYNTGHHGQLFGPGIYFSDSYAKAHLYSNDWGYSSNRYKFLLLCEVALGKIKEFKEPSFDTKIESEYKSVKGIGRTYPNPQHNIVLSNGAIVPAGKFIQNQEKNVQLQYNEYIVYKESQVRVRYIVQVE